MKLISHRGNILGRKKQLENNPNYIENTLKLGYDVEVDVWWDDEKRKLWLGHCEPQYEVSWWWLAGRADNLWIHCKDFTTLHEFTTNTSGYNYFWHQGDDYTLTSKNYIWSSPGKPFTSQTVMVIENVEDVKEYDCYGICSDYVGKAG